MTLIRSYEAPVEPGGILLFARSVGDTDDSYMLQLSATEGSTLRTSPTFVRSFDHFDPASKARPTLPCQDPGWGGSSDVVHAEQHFEFFEPMRVGDLVTVQSHAGASWTRVGRTGQLQFVETITEYRNRDGSLLVRAKKTSVRTLASGQP